MAISLPKAQFIALCISTVLYGAFFAMVLITTAVMSFNVTDDVRKQRTKILPVSYAMLAVATMHFIIVWVQGVDGFIDQKGGSVVAIYADISDTTSLLKSTFLTIQSVMGDGIMIWRLYIVYGKRLKIIIAPIILVTSYTVVGIIILAITKRARSSTDIFHVATTWITAYFSLTMTTNVLLTGAIAMRVLLAGNPLRGSRPHWLIIFALVESSALYTLNVIASLATFLSGSFGQYIAVDSIVPIVGISFTLIVLQIRFHVSTSSQYQGSGPPSGRSHSSGTLWPQQGSRPAGGDEPNYIRMAVHVSKPGHPPHVVGKDAYDSSAFDMVKQTPV